ncbi:high-affinity nitrate transporter 2.2-like [Bidens hawaiensis]|uniref:high-affinity nitrate transporter 2.2-like n=1 Tax=Bidens hawaiensis TaxID=980011 RepID=UPI004049955A
MDLDRRFSVASTKMHIDRTIHLSSIAFITTFISSRVTAPLVPIIHQNLHLTKSDIWTAEVAYVSGGIFSRLVLGAVCDLLGPDYGCTVLIMLSAPTIFVKHFVSDVSGYMSIRFMIGLSLATLVPCKCSAVIRMAYAGWGNVAGYGQDLPALHKKGDYIAQDKFGKLLCYDATDYGTWMCLLLYGHSLCLELNQIDNVTVCVNANENMVVEILAEFGLT